MSRRDFLSVLSRAVREDRERSKDIVPRRVLGRNTDGTERVVRLDGHCTERSGVGGHEKGQVLLLPGAPEFGSRGATGIATGFGAPGALVHLESQTPRSMPSGLTADYALVGRGFYDGMQLEYLTADGETVHPEITVNSITVHSSTSATVNVTVASTATVETSLPVAYQ